MGFLTFLGFTALCLLVYFYSVFIAALEVLLNDSYFSNHPDSKFRKIFHRKPFKCELCSTSWSVLINFLILYLIVGNRIALPMVITLFVCHFVQNLRREKEQIL